jgi:glutamate carboxypeptidase
MCLPTYGRPSSIERSRHVTTRKTSAETRAHPLLSELEDALPQMIADTEALVSTESPSNDLEAVAASAACVAKIGTDRLNAEPELIVIEGCSHLRWRFERRRDASQPNDNRVLILTHHDTVWPLGSAARLDSGISGGLLRGPGCLDMKAGIAIAFHALALLSDRSGVTLLVTGDEEVGSKTSRDLILTEAKRCTAVLVLEPSAAGGALKIERKGRSHYRIDISGVAAHAGVEPDKGANAVVELARIVLACEQLADPAAGTTVTPTLIRGGTSENTVPEQASLELDVRARSRSELERVDRLTRGLIPAGERIALDVEGGVDRLPLEREASRDLFALAQRLAKTIGLTLQGSATGGGSDGNLTAGLGIPTLDGLGAVGEGLHARHEHVLVDKLPERAALLALLLTSLLGGEL